MFLPFGRNKGLTVNCCSASSWSFSSINWPSVSCFSLKWNQKSVSWGIQNHDSISQKNLILGQSDLRSSWFCLSSICFTSFRWLRSCLICFSEERSEDTCWFCIFRSFWIKFRFWTSCSKRKVSCLTCKQKNGRKKTKIENELFQLGLPRLVDHQRLKQSTNNLIVD